MITIDESEERAGEQVDGRAARRERNVNAVLDIVIELFTEGELFPTVEQISKRSGLSVRSIYRYFADPAELHDAAIKRHRELSEPLAHLPSIGRGSLAKRVEDFVTMRLRLYEGVGAAYRATVHNAPRHPRMRDELARNRTDLRAQFERQFAPELSSLKGVERDAVVAAGDVLTQLDSIDLLRRHRQLSVAEAVAALRAGLCSLLGGDR
ncbi:MAG: TetR/AcrR family transcriptional regulator [Acidimicrobiia bacterium]|nr:TetR/AcrR family transcriptional regulator [Acidimicrobiia bacterium]